MASKTLVVAGGSGFVGLHICRAAVSRGWNVRSLSRRGGPDWSDDQKPRWTRSVEWAKADILKPESYAPLLKDATAVVHSAGILLETNYKGVLQGRDSLTGIFHPASAQTTIASNASAGSPATKKVPLTYGLINRDTAIALARESSNAKVPTFLFISAAGGAPMLPSGYISSKREAESLIQQSFPDIRSIFMRMPFMWDASRKVSLPIALGGYIGSEVNLILKGKLTPILESMVVKPMQASMAGEAIVEALENQDLKGVVEPGKVEFLGTQGWRKNMP